MKPSPEPSDGSRATIRDVAERAQVSIGTVSRVVAGSARVSEALAGRVRMAVEELGYLPYGRMQAVKRPSSRLISCLVADIANLLYGPVVAAAETKLARAGFMLSVANTANDSRRERELLSLLAERPFDGAILSLGTESVPELGAILADIGLPVVILDRQPPPNVDSVLVDHRGGTRSAADYLIGLGHSRIGLITAAGHIRPARERLAGLRAAYAAAGIDFVRCVVRTECGTADTAFAATSELLRLPDRPTALLTLGSQALLGALRAVKNAGLKIPGDLSVICFGDTEFARFVEPQISCVRWDLAALGYQTVELLLNRLDGRLESEARHIVLPTDLILRQSCAPPRPAGVGYDVIASLRSQ